MKMDYLSYVILIGEEIFFRRQYKMTKKGTYFSMLSNVLSCKNHI
jgi:hypothetical protein